MTGPTEPPDAAKPEYLANLRAAMDWALSGDRTASRRTAAAIAASDGRYLFEEFEAARDRILTAIEEQLEGRLDAMLDEAADRSSFPELDRPPEEIWQEMLFLNRGIFATTPARDLFKLFMVTIPSAVPGSGPLYLSPNLDGWGVKPPPDRDETR